MANRRNSLTHVDAWAVATRGVAFCNPMVFQEPTRKFSPREFTCDRNIGAAICKACEMPGLANELAPCLHSILSQGSSAPVSCRSGAVS